MVLGPQVRRRLLEALEEKHRQQTRKRHEMRIQYLVFIGMILVAVASYVGSHEDISTFQQLFGNVQHVFGLLGVVGSVIGAFFAKSPMNGNGLLSKITGNGTTPVPKDVN